MSQPALQIVDLSFDTPGNPVAVSEEPLTGSGPTFENVLGDLLGMGGLLKGELQANLVGMKQFASELDLLSSANSEIFGQQGEIEQQVSSRPASSAWTNGANDVAFGSSETYLLKANVADGNQVASEREVSFNKDLQMLLPESSLVGNHQLTDILTEQVSKIEAGRYEIISNKVDGDNLNLVLKDASRPDSPIKISLPVNLIKTDLSSDLLTATKRVELQSGLSRPPQLDDLFSKLNLKELVVENGESRTEGSVLPKSDSARETIRMSIIAEDNGRSVLLRAKANRTSVRVTRKIASINPKGEPRPAARQPVAEPISRLVPGQLPVGKQGSSPLFNFDRLDNSRPLQFVGQESSAKASFPEMATVDSSNLMGSQTAAKPDFISGYRHAPHSTRFSLPEDIGDSLKTGGKSVSIKLHPEHLGPAKLHLSMVDNILRARLTVESIPAKVAVEASLDKLTEKLAEANIKVDFIDVNVSDDNHSSEQFDQRWHSRGRSGFATAPSDKTEIVQEESTDSGYKRAPTTYVGAGGVNLLA